MTRKLVNDWGHSGTLVAKRYGCEAVGWEFKFELDLLLLLMLCETISYHGCKGQGKLLTPKQNLKKEKKNQTSMCNLGKPKKKLCKESSS